MWSLNFYFECEKLHAPFDSISVWKGATKPKPKQNYDSRLGRKYLKCPAIANSLGTLEIIWYAL